MRGKPIRWRARALADLQAAHEWLETLENAQPAQTISRIRIAAESMRRLGDIGRPGIEPGVRELSVRNAPYVIIYRVQADWFDILAVYHTGQQR